MNRNNFNGLILLLSVILMVFILISNVSAVNPDNSTNLVSSNVSSSPLSEDNNVICDDSNNTSVKGVLSSDESDVIYISPEGNGSGSFNDSSNLENAIKQSGSSGTIIFLEGNYTVNSTQDIYNKDLVFKAAPNSSVFINSKLAGDVFSITSKNVCFINLNFNNNILTNGSIIKEGMGSLVNIENCTFNYNSGRNGGCVYVDWAGHLNVNNSSFMNNYAKGNGGCIYSNSHSEISVNNSIFKNNFAEGNGGCIYSYSYSKTLILNSIFEDNNVKNQASGVYSEGDDLKIDNCTFNSNHGSDGGVIGVNKVNTIINNSNFKANNANNGGCIYFEGKYRNLDLINSNFANNTALREGGCVYIKNDNVKFNVNNCNFTGNNIDNFNENTGYGGVIRAVSVNITDSTFKDNFANFGGVIWLGGHDFFDDPAKSYITNSSFIHNHVGEFYVYEDNGGVIWNDENLEVTSSIFQDNEADGFGGAVYVNQGKGSLKINNCVLINNNDEMNIQIQSKGESLNIENNWWGSNNPDFRTIHFYQTFTPKSWVIMNLNKEGDNAIVSLNTTNNGNPVNGLIPERNVVFTSTTGTLNPNTTVTNDYGISTSNYTGNDLDSSNYIITAKIDSQILTITYDNQSTNPDELYYGENNLLIINLNSTDLGNVSVIVNGETYNVTDDDNDGVVVVELNNTLSAGDYIAKYNYINNENMSIGGYQAFTIYQATPNINSEDVTIIKDNSAIINANVTGVNDETISGNITFTLENENQTVILVNGSAIASFNMTTPGIYTVKIVYNGNKNYTKLTTSINVFVNENSTSILTKVEGTDLSKVFKTPSNYTGTLTDLNDNPIENQIISLNLTRLSDGKSKIYNVTTDENGEYKLPINLSPGFYTATPFYKGQGNYISSTGLTNKIIVTTTDKTSTNLSSDEFNHTENAGLNFTGKLLETITNEPIPEQTIYLNLTRTTTGQSKIYKVTTNENGQYQLPINLAKGTYTIKCSYKGTNIYEESTTNNHITIN